MGKQLLKAILFTGLIFISWNFYAQTKGIKLSDLKPISAFFEATTVEEEIVPEINSTPKEIRKEVLKVEETFACNITLDSDSGTDNQTVCPGGTIDQIDYSVDGGGTIAVSNLPNGLFVIPSFDGDAITIIGIPTESGIYTISATGGTCVGTEEVTGTITVDPTTEGGSVSGGTIICEGSTSAQLTLAGHVGDVVRWQSAVSPFSSWTDIANTSDTYTSGTLSETTQFRAVVQSGTCPEEFSDFTTVTVDPTTEGGSVSGGTIICEGSTSAQLTLAGHVGDVVRWQSAVSPFSSWTDIANTSDTYTSGTLSETTQFRAVVQSGTCPEEFSDFTTVTVDPTTEGGSVSGGTIICEGSTSAQLTLAGHVGDVVRWQSAVSPFSSWTDIANTSDTYTSGTLSETTQFRAVVQSGTCPEEFSDFTTVTVDPTTEGGSVSGGTIICEGSTSAQLTLAGHVGDVVRWQSAVSPFSSWTDIANTSDTYTSGTLSETTQFRAVVQSGTCPEEFSDFTTVTVDPTTEGGSVSGGTIICEGSTSAQLTLAGHVGDVVRWQSAVSPFSSWTDIANTSDTYTSGTLSETTQFRAVVQSGTCPEEFSDFTTVTVDPTTEGGSVSGGTIICEGSTSAQLTLAGHVGDVVRWQSAVSPFSSWTDIANTSDTYTSGTLSETTQFRAVVQSGTCPEEFSDFTTVTVDPTTEGGSVSGGTIICEGSTSAQLTLAGHVGDVVRWQSAVSPFSSWTDIANTSDTYTSGTLSETTQFRAVVQSGTCPEEFSDFTTVTVDPLPIPTFEEEPLANVCVGTSVTYTTQSGSGESNYVWSIQGVPGTDYTVTSGGTSTTDPTVTLTWLTEGSKDVYVYYSNSNNCTPINSAYNNITVNPLPVPTFDEEPGIEICEQDAVTYTTKAGQSDYIWNIPGIEGTDYVITAGGIGDTNESVTIQWLTTGSETVTVSYTDSVNGCIASSTASSTTEVEPFASVGPTSVAYPSVCISSPTLTPFTQATTGVTAIGTPVGLPDGISATFDASTGLITFSGTATTPTIGAQTYSIPLIGDCINGLEATGTIEVVPQLALTSVSSISASSVGGAATVTINGDPSILTNGEYEVTYIMESDVPNTIGPEIASPVTVTNGKGVFRTVDLPEDDAEVYQLTIQSISKIIDGNPVCPVNLDQTSPDNTTYFSVCGATFTADGTFYVPAGITEITVQVWGAGAGGGSKKTKGAGGGGGGFSSVTVSVNPGDPIGVFVGKGGAGGVTNGNSAIKGGDSYVTKNSSDPNPQTTSIAYAYGGSAPTISGPGIGGVGTTSNGQNGFIETSLTGGKGGDGGNGGTGGAGGSGSGNAKGLNGSGPGGGGGGAKGNADGGNGADGFVLISYSCTDANKFDCIEVIDDGASTGTTIIEFICDTQWNAPQGLIDFTVLVGGGGGGGGGGEGSGGGGAGGLVSQVFSTNDPNGLPAGTSYGIVVGEGGPGASGVNQIGQPGEESSFTGSINGSPIEIIVPGGGGGGSFNNPHGGSGAAGGGGGAKPNDPNTGASGEFGNGGTVDAYTYTGTNVNVYLGNIGGEGDFSNSQNSVAGGGGSGLSQEIGTNNLPAGIGKKGKAAGNGQGEGGAGGEGISIQIEDYTLLYGAGGGGIGEFFNGTDKVGLGGSVNGIKIGGDGNLTAPSPVGYPGRDKTGSGGGAGYIGGGKGGDGIVVVSYYNFQILQVEYLYFEAKFDEFNRNGLLSWATSKEWANAKFDIERSIGNANNWEKIGEVAGQGYKDSQTDYTFTDTQLPAYGGNVFYRLKQVDFEDTFTYSVTRAIQVPSLKGKSNWIIYPNPSELRSNVTVGLINPSNYHDEPIIVRISDVRGINVSYSANSVEEVNQAVNSYLETAISGMHIVQLIWGDQNEQLKLIRK